VLPTSYKRRVAVLRGGPSSEYDVSLQTGLGVIAALKESDYEVKDIIISKRGEWLVHGFVKHPESALVDVDVVFIALHGSYGEDGTVQRILERLNIPYTGSGSYASAIAMNKALTKDYLKKHSDSVKMAPHLKLTRSGISNLAQTVESIGELFGPEYVIKPVGGGSSIGTILTNRVGLLKSIQDSLAAHEEVLVEQRIIGKEATVGILEDFRNTRYYQLPAIEIVPPPSAQFFSADVKYSGETEEICPGRFSKDEKQELSALAQEVHQLLGLRQYSRSDFIVASDGIYFLEVNTLPGLTSQSLFPRSMEAVGSSYKELVNHLIITL
jgi:D-alanine-D-alanine ligase